MQKVFYDGIRVEYGISMEIPHKKIKWLSNIFYSEISQIITKKQQVTH